MPTPLKDYFLIGDLHTSALVSAKGSIDWFCVPSFDSPSIFGALLDERIGGRFAVDTRGYATSASYMPDLPIVETRFESESAAFTVRDCMLPRPTEEVVAHFLVRTIIGVRGTATVRFLFDPSPLYAKQRRVLIRRVGSMLKLRLNDRTLWLHLPTGATTRRHRGGGMQIEIPVMDGETKQLVLEYSFESRFKRQERHLEEETIAFWREWISRGTFPSAHRSVLIRSAITLKLMQFYPTGGIVAAPTTSLPEKLGGTRNWDYRFVWIRDATFTLYAFSFLGYTDEAKKFFRFIEAIVEESLEQHGQEGLELSVLYTIWGQPPQEEEILDHLEGYAGSRPVRIGNAAADQFQLDLYGSLIDCYYFFWRRELPVSAVGRHIIEFLLQRIEERWKFPDSGIWEVRGGMKHFTYSKVMAWVGVDRALRMADHLNIESERRSTLEKLRDEIKVWIWDHCYDTAAGTFRQHPETTQQDATNFLLVPLQFLDRHDPRTKKVMEATRRELMSHDVFVYRYHADDGLPGREGGFVLCSFWMMAALAAVGEADEARRLFLSFQKRVAASGLLSEEMDTETGEYLGNFPQAFSHIGAVLAAYYIERYGKPNVSV